MNESHDLAPPPLPDSLRAKLVDLRRRLWSTKTMEAAFAALFGLVTSYLLVFALDRIIETPGWLRLVLLVAGLVGGVVFLPLQLSRWVLRHASLLQVARRVAREDILGGDQLLSVVELTQDAQEFRRSPALFRAAIQQGEQELAERDLTHTLPKSRHRGWGALAGAGLVATVLCFAVVPAAGKNAFARWLKPLGAVERYTFARLEAYDAHKIVARFEPFQIAFDLSESTRRRPASATLTLSSGEVLTTNILQDGYAFEVPALTAAVDARLVLGDYRGTLRFEPLDRPEVRTARSSVLLPAYLELPTPLDKDVRGGSVGVVEGSSVSVSAELTRELSFAEWTTPSGAVDTQVNGSTLTTSATIASASVDTSLRWQDIHGLEGTVPFQLTLRARPDGKPTVVVDGLKPDTILLHDQAALFSVRANDDFGIRKVGLEWTGSGEVEGDFQVAQGEKLLGLGEADSTALELRATLHPKLLGIDPQVLQVRAWALDALPGRERMYSAPIRVQVMTADDHMIWLTRALAGWYDEAVEVRDEEQILLKTNEGLFELTNDELVTAEVQRQIQAQAAAERVNGRRLGRLVASGSALLTEAARNLQFNSNTLNDWAEMMSTLEDIADNRMPSVAGLLGEAARAEASKPLPAAVAGVNREDPPTEPAGAAETPALPSDPAVADIESSFNDPAESKPAEGASTPPPASLGLPGTVVQGGGAATDDPPPPPSDEAEQPPSPTREQLAKALAEQRALMEEFQKVAGMISEILANLEGSTFVKRLKALSRAETGVAQDLDATLASAFGAEELPANSKRVASKVGKIQESSGQRAALVREDLGAYIERLEGSGRETGKFVTVRTEMGDLGVAREMDVVGDLALASRSGEAIAGAENLADNLDRWAELLVGPGSSGAT